MIADNCAIVSVLMQYTETQLRIKAMIPVHNAPSKLIKGPYAGVGVLQNPLTRVKRFTFNKKRFT